MWIKQSTTVSSESQMLFSINTSTGGNICNLQIGTNEFLGIYDGANSHYGGTAVTDGEWHHVGYTYEEATGNTSIYVDGALEATYTNSQTATSTALYSLGQEFDSGLSKGNYFEGEMTEVAIWNEVLNPAEIALLMNATIDNAHPKRSNLMGYYPMNKVCGDDLTIVEDISGNGLDGKAYGTIGNKGINVQSVSMMDTISGFNSIVYFSKNWIENGSSVSTDDSLVVTPYSNASFTLELTKGPFKISDDFEVVMSIAPTTMNQTLCSTDTLFVNGTAYTASNTTGREIFTNIGPFNCDSVVNVDLNVAFATSATDVRVACDSLQWIDGNTYSASNTSATFVMTNAAGCDSVVSLNLTVNASASFTDVQTACNSYTWTDGNTYTASNNTAFQVLTNSIGCDSVVTLNLTISNSSVGTDVQTACGSYTWIDGNTYSSSNNTATHTLSNAAGCDSVVTLNLTVNNGTSGTDTRTACNSFTWIDGNTYSASNTTATHTLTNAVGCDSIVTLNLTINNSTSSTDVQSACNSFTWIDGNTYTSSNTTATHTLSNAAGCDSLVTLNLTITNSTSAVDIQSACGAYTWIDGNTYTSSNTTATHLLTNAAGCDSLVTLNLTINSSTAATDVQSGCGSYTWIDGNTYTSSNTTATHTLTNAAGCDSIVTLNLTINNGTIATDVQTACGSYTWIDGNTYTSSNNTAMHTLVNAAGCDSIVTLDLTVNTVNTSTSTAGETITASAIGATYQWLDCNNGNAPIAGATSQSYTATVSGDYAVLVTENGCTDTSACVNVIVVGVDEALQNAIFVYPNPFQNTVNVELGNLDDATIRLFNITGQLVYFQEHITTTRHQFELDAPAGVYLLEVAGLNVKRRFKLIKR